MIRPQEAQRPLTVTELAREVQRHLRPLNSVIVKGEVSNLKRTAKGNYTFAVRDSGAVIQAFFYGADVRRLGIAPEDGQVFIFRGRIEFWASGQLSLIVNFIQFDDVGRLRAQLEQLKHKLEQEGAFSPMRKRPLPFLPHVVALITSPTGAVIHDLQETIRDRYPNMEILVYAAQVQGTASPGSVVSAIRRCNADGLADVMVIARGGGSFEELYAFNTEPVARAILASVVPVVTALGHTSDRTVADMVADAECRTPTEAGARVVPRKLELVAQLAERRRRLAREWGHRMRAETDRLQTRRQRLRQALPAILRRRVERLERCRAELARLTPASQLERRQEALGKSRERLDQAIARLLKVATARNEDRRVLLEQATGRTLRAAAQGLEHRRQRLAGLSPRSVLARGYSITLDGETGRLIRTARDTAPGREVRVTLHEGNLDARVEQVRP